MALISDLMHLFALFFTFSALYFLIVLCYTFEKYDAQALQKTKLKSICVEIYTSYHYLDFKNGFTISTLYKLRRGYYHLREFISTIYFEQSNIDKYRMALIILSSFFAVLLILFYLLSKIYGAITVLKTIVFVCVRIFKLVKFKSRAFFKLFLKSNIDTSEALLKII